MYIDTHAHLTSESLINDLDNIITRATTERIDAIINISADRLALERALNLPQYNIQIYHAAATAPHDINKEGEEMFPIIAELARSGKLIALGETGLDYYYHKESKDMQQNFLKKYMLLAKECKLPLIIHCREAFSDFFKIADSHYKDLPAVIHCFTGTTQEALEILKRGWYISFSGILTFKNSNILRETASEVPLDRIFIETDAPYLAPQNFRGKINEPSYLPYVAKTLATIHHKSLTEIAEYTHNNALNFFEIEN